MTRGARAEAAAERKPSAMTAGASEPLRLRNSSDSLACRASALASCWPCRVAGSAWDKADLTGLLTPGNAQSAWDKHGDRDSRTLKMCRQGIPKGLHMSCALQVSARLKREALTARSEPWRSSSPVAMLTA